DGAPPCACTERILTIEPAAPRPRRWLTSRCMRKNGARALTAKSLSQNRRSASASDPRSVRAAELAKASTWPKRMSAASKISSGASGFSRSAATNKPAAPHRSTSATAAAPLAASLPVTTTASAPALAAARAMAKPMPWVEPVTTITRPFTAQALPLDALIVLDQSRVRDSDCQTLERLPLRRIDNWRILARINIMAQHFPIAASGGGEATHGRERDADDQGPGLVSC